MNEQLIKNLHSSTSELINTISSCKQEQFDSVPFEGSWSAGQLAEHMVKSDGIQLNLVNGPTVKSERPQDEKEEQIKNVFLGTDNKMKAPDFITPLGDTHNKTEIISALQKGEKEIEEIINTKDLSETCTGFSFPGLGELTRYEWICLNIYHKQRHTRQLKNILDKLS